MGRSPDNQRVLRPGYLTEADYPWLERLIEEVTRLVGRRRSDVLRRLGEPFPFDAPEHKLRLAKDQLVKALITGPVGAPAPSALRAALFKAAVPFLATPVDGNRPALGSSIFRAMAVHAATGERLEGADVRSLLLQRLYADIPGERIIAGLPPHLTPTTLAVATNEAIVARFLKRADEVTIDLLGETRRVVRQAKLRGLLCTVSRTDEGTRLTISGPLAVIRRTKYYGRALTELIPFLAWCPRFDLVASCVGTNGPFRVQVHSGDPLPTAPAKPTFDSLVEQRFAKDFGRATDDWDLVREPEPLEVPVGDGPPRLVFPDFAAVARTDPRRRWLIEIVGFWTPLYLASKLESLRIAGADRLILCIDARLACDDVELPENSMILRYTRRIDVEAVLEVMNG